MIDEIDIYHSARQTLWKAAFRTAQKYDVQVFTTTHSDKCTKAYLKAHHTLYDAKAEYHREAKDGHHRAVKYDVKDMEATLRNNWEYR